MRKRGDQGLIAMRTLIRESREEFGEIVKQNWRI